MTDTATTTDSELREMYSHEVPCGAFVELEDGSLESCPNSGEWIITCKGCRSSDFLCDPCYQEAILMIFDWCCDSCTLEGSFTDVIQVERRT